MNSKTPPVAGSGKISVVVNTYNAARLLPQVLRSVSQFDEVLVCDMESTDDTLAIARDFGCRVVTFPRRHHTIVEPARDFAIHEASSEWVLVVDADELVTPQLREALYDHIRQPSPAAGLLIPRRNRLMGRFLHGYYPDYNLRFFRRDAATWPPVIHAQPRVEGEVRHLPASRRELAIDHLDDRSVSQRLDKINHYTEHEVAKRAGRHYPVAAFFYRPLFRFCKAYLLKGGFRDGVPGLIFAGLEAVQQFAILAKLYEYHRNQSPAQP